MTAALAAVLVLLVGARLRLQPGPRDPVSDSVATSRSARNSVILHRCRRRRRARSSAPDALHVAAWCDELARAVGAGSTLTAAVRHVDPPAPCVDAIDPIRLALERGVALREACRSDCGSHDLQLALTVLRACAAQGGPAGEPLSRTAATLRGRAADEADRRTQSAQARLSATVMTILPAVMLAVLMASSGAVRGFVASPAGVAVLAIGAVLNSSGWRWMKRLIEGHTR